MAEQFHTIPIGDDQYAVIAVDIKARTARWVKPEQGKSLYKSRQAAAWHREREEKKMPRATLSMWDREVKAEFQQHGGLDGNTLVGEMTLLIPESLHQQLEDKKPLQLICAGHTAQNFEPCDNVGNKVSYECRITYAPGQNWSIMYGHSAYATLAIDTNGQVSLFAL